MVDQRFSVIPRRLGRGRSRDIVTLKARDRNGSETFDSNLVSKGLIIGNDLVEGVLAVIDKIHLVHRQHQMLDAEQMREIAVPPRLDEHTLARIDKDNRQISGRGARDHIARILLMTRSIGDNELALFGCEEAVGNVDCYALLALGRQSVDQQCEVNFVALRALRLAVGLKRGQLIFKDHLAVIQQPPDQRALAIIHAAAGDEAEQLLVLMLVEISVNIFSDQRFGFINGLFRHQK